MGTVEQDLADIAARVARLAGDLARTSRDTAIQDVDTKSTLTDVVTAADRAAERLVRAELAVLRPGDAVLGEEEGGAAGEPGRVTWVVDPIDGTVNYLYGYPWYCVSIGAQVDGVSVAGAVFDPSADRMWVAALGSGASLNGVTLSASKADRLDLALVGTGFAYAVERRQRQADAVARLIGSVRDIRRNGSAALDFCAVAAGWLDGYFEVGLGRWDWAAGALIAAEAGAVVAPPGSDPDLGEGAFAAAPGIATALRTAVIASGLPTV